MPKFGNNIEINLTVSPQLGDLIDILFRKKRYK
jgi:hypothetical protein